MKKNFSRLKNLFLVLFIILIIFLLKNKLTSFFSSKTPQPFSSIKKESVLKVVVISNEKRTEIYQKNNHWYLKKENIEFSADKERVEKIIDAFLSIKKEEIVSQNKNKHQEFGINKQQIILNTKDKNYSLFLGNQAGINKNYVRIDQESEVFLAENFNNVFYPDDFRDLNPHLIDNEEDVNYLEINFNNKKIILNKKNNQWQINQKNVKKEKVDFFLNSLKTLKANDILTKEDNLTLTNPVFAVKIKENNKEKSVDFFQKDEENYYIKTKFLSFIYQINTTEINSLKKEEKDFFE
ncbi:MAG: DUF4340 domain-containing protein [Patescibacteria group bacterium]|nr:DUF4340 domain-containing protein [Patescibacteria group bacterium]